MLQMKMPSKKCAHIPVYTLGFESLQRVPTTKATPTLRRDAFQYVLLPCCWYPVVVTGKPGRFLLHCEIFPREHVKSSGSAKLEGTEPGWSVLGPQGPPRKGVYQGRHCLLQIRHEEGGKRQFGGGVTGYGEQDLGCQRGRARPLGDPGPNKVLLMVPSLDPCRDRSGGVWRKSSHTSTPTAAS